MPQEDVSSFVLDFMGIENGQGVHVRRARLWWRLVTSTMSTCTFGKISPPHRDHM